MTEIYKATAQLRFPNYRIEGSGHLACVNHCKGIVTLFDLPMFAQHAAAEKCGPRCIEKHAVVVIHNETPESYPTHRPARFPTIRDKAEAISA